MGESLDNNKWIDFKSKVYINYEDDPNLIRIELGEKILNGRRISNSERDRTENDANYSITIYYSTELSDEFSFQIFDKTEQGVRIVFTTGETIQKVNDIKLQIERKIIKKKSNKLKAKKS